MGVIVELVKFVTQLSDTVQDKQFAANLREIQRLTGSLQVEHAALQEQRIQVLSENADLKQQIVALQRQSLEMEKRQGSKQTLPEQFCEHRGAIFKRKPAGGYHDAVFCPQCKKPMTSFNKMVPFTCGDCHTAVAFTGRELWKVMQELPA